MSSLVKKIGIGNLLNAILVNENVRPAMLVQPIDNEETTSQDPKTKIIIETIKETFPELLLSENYIIYQGIIISKTDYNGQTILLGQMGEILGYPCYKDFGKILFSESDNLQYTIDVKAVLSDGTKIQLFANMCKDTTNIEKFEKIAEKAKEAFKNPQYTNLLQDVDIIDVEVITTVITPTSILIDKLANNEILKDYEINEIINILYNLGFSEKISNYDFQYNNPIHKGILLDLLIRSKHDTLEPFYPLNEYPEQYTEVKKITVKQENALFDVLEKTKLIHGGKKTKTRKTKTRKTRKTKTRKTKTRKTKTRNKKI